MPEPWEQLRGEPKESYCRFLFYRNLGPGRSLNLAYRIYLNTLPPDAAQPKKAVKGSKRQQAPGHWYSDSERFRWNERGTEWDIAQLERIGVDVAPLWAGILREGLLRSAQALANPKFRPKKWRDAFVVLQYLNADVIHALCPAKSASIPSGVTTSPQPEANRPPDPGTITRDIAKPADKPTGPTRESVE